MLQGSSLHSPEQGFPEIISIDRTGLLRKLRAISARLVRDDPNVLQIILHGSVAKGNYTPESDIDIMIVVREAARSFLLRRDAFALSFLDLPLEADIKVYTRDEVEKMRQSRNPFIEDVLKLGIRLASRELS